MERAATAPERAAILTALPPDALGERGVVSVLAEHEGALLDGALVIETGEAFLRPLPTRERSALDVWVALLDRRRAQLVHDVSGPATGVLAALETVIEYEPIPPSSRAILVEARGGMLRLSRMLADRVSSLFSPRRHAGAGASVASLVRSIAELLDPDRGRLRCTITGDGEALAEVTLVDAALHVLLTNAWKFRRGQTVDVAIHAERTERALVLSVGDNGVGIDEPSLRRAGELGFTSRSNGVGLSLFLLRRAVSMEGGAIRMEGSAEGVLATVVLPVPG